MPYFVLLLLTLLRVLRSTRSNEPHRVPYCSAYREELSGLSGRFLSAMPRVLDSTRSSAPHRVPYCSASCELLSGGLSGAISISHAAYAGQHAQ
ncbi:hypothetical protein [Vibrio jasicida]|uniref:hypothetical protein n=1 Tax=Vibrio jasicida TaxID=766224 RepID=UPI0011B00217|nr:hypothetical protein [Vibrio jasicida]